MWSSSDDSLSSPEPLQNTSAATSASSPSTRLVGSTSAEIPVQKAGPEDDGPSTSRIQPRADSGSVTGSTSGSAPGVSNAAGRIIQRESGSEGEGISGFASTPLGKGRVGKRKSKRHRYEFNFERSSSSSSESSNGSEINRLDCVEVDQLLSSVKRRKIEEELRAKETSVASSVQHTPARKERRAVKIEEDCESLDERPHLDNPHFLSAKVSFAVDRGLDGEVPSGLKSTDDVSKLAQKMAAFRDSRKALRCKVPRLFTLAVQALGEAEVDHAVTELPQGLAEMVAMEREHVRRKTAVNACVNQYLTSYQREGVQFLFDAFQYGVGQWRGGVLADEMGLGKTVQVLAFVSVVQNKTGRPYDEIRLNHARHIGFPVVLIVCPASVLDNWHEETRRWGYFATEVAKTNEKIEQVLDQLQRRRLDIVIMSYAKLRHFNQMESFRSYKWAVAVFDEVHLCKNPASQTTMAAKALKARTKFGLTGTPVQNNLDEFWCIVDVLCPGLFLSLGEFRIRFTSPIRAGMRKGATAAEIKAKRRALEILSVWQGLLLLRREKNVLKAKLHSGKKDMIVLCPLSPLQEEAYLRFLDSRDVCYLKSCISEGRRDTFSEHLPLWRLQHRADQMGSIGAGSSTDAGLVLAEPSDESSSSSDDDDDEEEEQVREQRLKTIVTEVHESSDEDMDDGEADKVEASTRTRRFIQCKACPLCTFLPCMTILRKIANHLEMIRVDKSLGPGFERYKRLRTARIVLGADGELFRSRTFQRLSNEVHCGKLLVLKTLLRKWKTSGHKVLFFSNSTVLLDIVESFILKLNLRSLRLDGDTNASDRQSICREFNTDKHVFIMLISTKAGGVGLNLTGAQKVVIFDPSWNPSDDLQAQDRAYRIGQTQRVEVYRLISKGTIEEAALIGQIDKQQLASMVLDEKNFQKRLFHAGEVQGMKMKLSYFMEGVAQKARQNKSRQSGDQFHMSHNAAPGPVQSPVKFDILDENMEVFETCGIEDAVDWKSLVTHDEESKRAELAAIASEEQSAMLDRYRADTYSQSST